MLMYRKFQLRLPQLGALGDYLRHGREQGFEPLPIFEGTLTLRASAPTVLVCAHLAGPYLFGAEISFLDVLDALKRLGINVLVSLPGVHHLGYLAAVRQRAVRVAVLPYGWWKHGVAPCAQTVIHFQRFMQANKVDFVYLNTLVLDDPMAGSESAEPVGYRSCAGVARARFDTLRPVGG
jgi:hypothetical protein